METNDLTIVIVTFKSEEKIFSCIDSIPINISIQVVENSDNKAFKTKIEEKYDTKKWCKITTRGNWDKRNIDAYDGLVMSLYE